MIISNGCVETTGETTKFVFSMANNKLQRRVREEYEREYKGRPCICWCMLCVCSSLLIILIVFIIIIGTFVLPTMKLNNIQSGNPPYNITGGTFTGTGISGNLQDVTVLMNWILELEIDNPNYYGFSVDQLSINIYYATNNVLISQVPPFTVGVGPNSNTNQTVPVSVVLKLTGDQAATYMQIMNKCGYLGGTRSTLPLNYAITINTPPVNWFTVPTITVKYDSRNYLLI